MKIFNSDIFGKIQEPENFDEFMSIVTKDEDGRVPVRYWRGQGDISWPIDSAGFRRIKHNISRGEIDWRLSNYERTLLEHATHKGYRYYNGRELYDFELLARLQHHGAATRLVDFSKNALIALYFCVTNNMDKTGLLFGLHTDYVHGYENTMTRESYDEVITVCNKLDGPITWEPTNVSNRISAQHAQFLYSKVSDKKTGSLLLPVEDDACLFISINSKMKIAVKKILEAVLDFTTISLFPDVDGFGMANKFSVNTYDMYRW